MFFRPRLVHRSEAILSDQKLSHVVKKIQNAKHRASKVKGHKPILSNTARTEMKPVAVLRLAEAVGKPSHVVTRRISSKLSPSVLGADRISTNNQDPRQPQSSPFQQHAHSGQAQNRSFTSINNQTPYNLCFLRHGQSTWNRDNRFIGWTDTPLTDDGVLEARVAGKMLKNSGILFDEVHTSLLRRCIRTTNLVLMEVEQEYIPVHKVSETQDIVL